MNLNQVSLLEITGKGREKVTWVPVDKRVKTGTIITLKGVDGLWKVITIYPIEVEFNQIDHHGWDNNSYDKHTSLSMKRRLSKVS